MKYKCATHFEGCLEYTKGFRGVCINCYKKLVKWELIEKGDRFSDFPDWLKYMIRGEAALDMSNVRHPEEEYKDDFTPTEIKIPLGNGCFKARELKVPE